MDLLATSPVASFATSAPRQSGLALAKAIGMGLAALIAANVVILVGVGVLKGLGVPKSIANPLQLLYFPVMWVALRFLRRKRGLPAFLKPVEAWAGVLQVLGALGLVVAVVGAVLAVLHSLYGLAFALAPHAVAAYRWAFMAAMLLGTALVEEHLFRHYILGATLRYASGFLLVTGLNAALFLILHIQGYLLGDYTLLWGAAIFAMGLFLAAYVYRTRSLVFPVAFHALWNISTTMYVENDQTFNVVAFADYPAHEYAIADATAAVCLGVCLAGYVVLACWRQQPALPGAAAETPN